MNREEYLQRRQEAGIPDVTEEASKPVSSRPRRPQYPVDKRSLDVDNERLGSGTTRFTRQVAREQAERHHSGNTEPWMRDHFTLDDLGEGYGPNDLVHVNEYNRHMDELDDEQENNGHVGQDKE